jgi:hypothetical protein
VAEEQDGKMSAAPAQPHDDVPASAAQTPPPSIGLGHREYHFVQAVIEMTESLGEIRSDLNSMKSSIDSLKDKVDQLVAWKNMIFGGAVVLGAVISALAFIIVQAWNYVTIKVPAPQVQQAPGPK